MGRDKKSFVGKQVSVPRSQGDRVDKRLGPNRAPERPELAARIRESVEQVRAMPPGQLHAMLLAQAASNGRSFMQHGRGRAEAEEMPLMVLPLQPVPDLSGFLTDPRVEQARRQLRRALGGQPDLDSAEASLEHMEGCIRSALAVLESTAS